MDDQAKTTGSQGDGSYDDIVQSHRDYLDRLQAAFDEHCEEIGANTKAKLNAIHGDDQEERKKILLEEQEELNKALAQLKQVVNTSNAEVRHKLEELEHSKEKTEIELEKQLSEL